MKQPVFTRGILGTGAVVIVAIAVVMALWLAHVRETTLRAVAEENFSASVDYVPKDKMVAFARAGCQFLVSDRRRYVRSHAGQSGLGTYPEIQIQSLFDEMALNLLFGRDYCQRYAAFRWTNQPGARPDE